MLLIAAPASASAQEAGDGRTETVAADTAPPPRVRRPASPLGAFGRSVLLPGWGQATLGETTRGAFYFAAEAASLWMVFKSQAKLDAARRRVPQDAALIRSRSEQREDWIALAVFWSLFAGVDAWVSAHLWGFESEVVPPPDGSAGAELRWTFPVRGP